MTNIHILYPSICFKSAIWLASNQRIDTFKSFPPPLHSLLARLFLLQTTETYTYEFLDCQKAKNQMPWLHFSSKMESRNGYVASLVCRAQREN